MKAIAQHAFKNNKKKIVCYYLDKADRRKRKVPDCDCLCLSFESEGKGGVDIYLRPDEAILVARLLLDSVYKVTSDYKIRLINKGQVDF